MLVYVLDTSAVTDPRLRGVLGVSSLESVVRELTRLFTRAHIVASAQFYMTPSTALELRGFLERNGVGDEVINAFLSIISIKAPDMYGTRIPAHVMSNWIQEVSMRFYRGLRVAEQMIRKSSGLAYSAGEKRDRDLLEKQVAEAIHELRARYREATRKGVIDTIVDFDSVILAKELNGSLVTNDDGIKRLCQELGVKYIDPPLFISQLLIILRERIPRRP